MTVTFHLAESRSPTRVTFPSCLGQPPGSRTLRSHFWRESRPVYRSGHMQSPEVCRSAVYGRRFRPPFLPRQMHCNNSRQSNESSADSLPYLIPPDKEEEGEGGEGEVSGASSTGARDRPTARPLRRRLARCGSNVTDVPGDGGSCVGRTRR